MPPTWNPTRLTQGKPYDFAASASPGTSSKRWWMASDCVYMIECCQPAKSRTQPDSGAKRIQVEAQARYRSAPACQSPLWGHTTAGADVQRAPGWTKACLVT